MEVPPLPAASREVAVFDPHPKWIPGRGSLPHFRPGSGPEWQPEPGPNQCAYAVAQALPDPLRTSVLATQLPGNAERVRRSLQILQPKQREPRKE